MASRDSFTRYFLAGVLFRAMLGIIAMGLAFGGAALGRHLGGDWAPFVGACVGLVLGVAVALPVKRRWDPLNRVPAPVPADVPVGQAPVATGRDGSATHSLHEPG